MPTGVLALGEVSEWWLSRRTGRGGREAVAVVVHHVGWSGDLDAGDVMADIFGVGSFRWSGD
jgi:hypothetical protein